MRLHTFNGYRRRIATCFHDATKEDGDIRDLHGLEDRIILGLKTLAIACLA
jgi:hypothetical protein